MMFERDSLRLLAKALDTLEGGFAALPPAAQRLDLKRAEEVMLELAAAMRDNYPYFHPLYAGQMLKPPHPVARMGYMLSLWINPNNHALDAGRASSRMEKEAVAEIAALFGCPAALLRPQWPGVDFDTPEVTCLRACLIKPEHADWIEEIWKKLDEAVDAPLPVG